MGYIKQGVGAMGVLYFCNWIWVRKGLHPNAMNKLKCNESFWLIPNIVGDWS